MSGLASCNFSTFTIREVTVLGRLIRETCLHTQSMEDAANRIVNCLYENTKNENTGMHDCALIRLFITQSYFALPVELKALIPKFFIDIPLKQEVTCLTLLATIGDFEEWNNREMSSGHQVIPLPSEEIVDKFPMIRNLVRQLGLDVGSLINPDKTIMMETEQNNFGVFYIPFALGSPYIPAQNEFVIPCKIESVIGFGGVLPSGNVFSVIMFSKVHISREVADLFKNLALNVKYALIPHEKTIFNR